MPPIRALVVGYGNHMNDKLLPALFKLADENNVKLVGLVRQHPTDDKSESVQPVKTSLTDFDPLDYDLVVVSGPPSLHLEVIEFCKKNDKGCFVEKPHLLEQINTDKYPEKSMIGYNFNFIDIIDNLEIKNVYCGSKGIYRSWGGVFPVETEDYLYTLHAILVHPIAMIVQKYGPPKKVELNHFSNDGVVKLMTTFVYDDREIDLDFSSDAPNFCIDINTGTEIVHCKQFKATSYYNMLKYYFANYNHLEINTFKLGQYVLKAVLDIASQLN